MAIIDKIGKKISDAGQDAIKATKTMTEVTKLNSKIELEEKFILDCYKQIGTIYYSKYGKSNDADIQKQIDCINLSMRHIQDFKEQIKLVKGKDICSVCNAEIDINAQFCPKCGSKRLVSNSVSKEKIECYNCHTLVEKNLNFCTNCGAKLR